MRRLPEAWELSASYCERTTSLNHNITTESRGVLSCANSRKLLVDMDAEEEIRTSEDVISQLSEKQKGSQRLTPYAALSAVFAALTGLWQFGFSIGVINSASVPLRQAIAQHYEDRYGQELPLHVVNILFVVISAAFTVGGIFGAFLVNPVVRRFGRLRGMFLGHVLTIVMTILVSISGVIKSPEAMIIGRIGTGMSTSAIGTGITVMYITEISPRHLRGYFGTMVATGIIFGVTMANILGLPQILGSSTLWPVLLALTGLPSLLFVLLYKLMPQSPRRLFIENHDEDGTIKVLRRIRGVQNVALELTEMKNEANKSVSSKQITVVQAILIERYGRKRLLMFGYSVIAVSHILLTLSIETKNTSHVMPYVSVVALMGFLIGFASGPVPATFITVAECFDQTARSAAVTLSTVVFWILATTVVLSTPYLLTSIGGYLFLMEGIITICMIIWIYFNLPETKNRPFIEIQKSFHRRHKDEPDGNSVG